ncbi:hypothetical protein OG998_13675 [Streptomyces albidoflavus]|uniref:hypothetical protein n=1 Tax=Streptomyces albidoflavus TaxID=1886 RepID=UPI00225C374B|nr:hypothetical protein [Streptomyces albidoflavus]MCX4441881.1 hypothetical protein [Streptomyces albidoflavus]WTB76309.1 hypothetical protein OG998_13675 [Streptomyces albidoflavus]
MSDVSRPQPAVDDLAQLMPVVVPLDEADAELVVIGERYWALAGFAPELGTPVWCEKVKDIDTADWGQQIYVVAAAGVRAMVTGRLCPQCAGPLSLTSRAAFQQVCDGDDPACADCNESLTAAVRVVVDPARRAKREAARAKAEERSAIDSAHAAWKQLQRDVIAEEYVAAFPSNGEVPASGVREMVGALALLRYAPSTSPINAVASWPDPLHPDSDKIGPLLGTLIRADLLRIHASSPANAFVWQPATFEEALRAAEGDLDAVDMPQLSGSFYPLAAHYYAPHGASAGKAVEELDAHLTVSLAPAGMTEGRQEDLVAVARELIAEEALRYFTNRLDDLNLPAVPGNHSARLSEAAYKVAEHRPLGEIYNLVWRATRAAAEAAQKNPRAPRAHMTTHAVNRFETDAQRATADPGWALKPFTAITGQGPSAMTRALFYNLLDSDPIETGLTQLREALPEPVVAPRAADTVPEGDGDELATTVAWLNSRPDAWDPYLVAAGLSVLAEKREDSLEWHYEGKILARGAAHLLRLYERLAPVLGVREAVLTVFAATPMLTHPVTIDGTTLNSGTWLLDRLFTLFLIPSVEETNDAGEVPEE